MAERSKALRSGRSPGFWAWVQIPLLTFVISFDFPIQWAAYQYFCSGCVVGVTN